MQDELDKINAYFEEARKTWQKNPEMVLCRQFFQLWEQTQRPQPFAVTAETIPIAGQDVTVPGQSNSVAYFTWDHTEECPCLVVESNAGVMRVLITFDEGEPVLSECSVAEFDLSGVSAGERLEFVMDIIAQVREDHPARNVLEMRKSEYNEAVRKIADWYDRRTVKVMTGLKMDMLRKLIKKAVQDMALDELSDQLVLPLNGSYAAGRDTAGAVFASERAFAVHPSPPRTIWSIARDLDFLKRSGQVLAELENEFVLRFEGCEHLRGENPVYLRVPLVTEVPVSSGTRLHVYKTGDPQPLAIFTIDINDRTSLIGHLQWPHVPEEITCDFYARPQRSPAKSLAELMEVTAIEFSREGRFASAAVNAALGVDDFTFEDSPVSEGESELDQSQLRAAANAVNPKNALTLIQGPPGTGKTHVLAHVLHQLAKQGKRVLVAAPSNTAVDNVCRRAYDLPTLRVGHNQDRIAPDVARQCWIGDLNNVHRMQRERENDAVIYAGTHVGLLHDDIVQTEIERNGLFDVIIFDEAGMARMDEFLICSKMAHRAVLFGDHQQLPPFPLPDAVLRTLRDERETTLMQRAMLTQSALQWLLEQRQVPIFVLQSSYRCQNPRLMRFSSTLFYDAQVKASMWADYYRLPFDERQAKYPPSTLRLYTTSGLPPAVRGESLNFEGSRPGFENPLEARLAVYLLYEAAAQYELQEITVIAPYRRQVQLIRNGVDRESLAAAVGRELSDQEWNDFRHTRISTVDSFQGGESDIVIICYVRSNAAAGIGFVDDPNRINVAHTRCRREMVIIADCDCLKNQARNQIFHRMERAIRRDGEIRPVTEEMVAKLPDPPTDSDG